MTHPRADKIIAQCELAYPMYKGDCVDFAADVIKHFFTVPDFDGTVLADTVVADLRTTPTWRRTRSIPAAIAAAKSGDFVVAGLRAAELSSAHGHLAIIAGVDGQVSGTVVVPIGYAGSIGGSPIKLARLSGTFKATLVRAEAVDYFIRTPDLEPTASGLSLLLQAGATMEMHGQATTADVPPIAFGKKVSPEFRRKASAIALKLGIQVNHLMAAMAFETGASFSPSVRNKASGATGLIQFMATTATALGTDLEALAAMTAEIQLDYVERYFAPYKNKLANLADVYMAILWPKGINKPDDWPLFVRDSESALARKRYEQNSGLDANKDGLVTRHEAAWKVEGMLKKGLLPAHFG